MSDEDQGRFEHLNASYEQMGGDGGGGGDPPADLTLMANIEAEAALLGTILIDNRVLGNVRHLLRDDDFVEELHGRIYRQICDVIAEGKVASPITLRPYFGLDKRMAEIGGVKYLAQLTGSGAGLIGHVTFAQQIRDLADLRKMKAVMEEGIAAAAETSEGIRPRIIMENVLAGMLQAGERQERAKVRSAANMIGMARKRITAVRAGENIGAACRTIPDLNDLLGPLAAGTVTVVGGRPGMGKSVLAQSWCLGVAANDEPTLFISNEMNEELLALRMAADITHALDEAVPYSAIQEGKTSSADDAVLAAAENTMGKMPLDIVAPDRSTIEEIETIITRIADKWKRKGRKLRLVAIDYLQIIGSVKKFRDPRERIDYISERCVAISKREDCAIVLLSQLSRAVEQREGARPQLSDLKESGRIEEDATNVVLVWRPEYYLEGKDRKNEGDKGYEDWLIDYERSRGKVDLIVPKARMKPGGTVRRVRWFGASQAIRGSEWREPFMGEGNDLIPREWIVQ